MTPPPAPATSIDEVAEIARRRFGWDGFRSGQKEAIEAVLDGKDTLAVMPTGSGKSAIYQLAALTIDGPTVVVSPLIALQKDQVGSLIETGVEDAAHANSTQTRAERERTFESLRSGQLEFLFIAPEQFANDESLAELLNSKPSLFVVDEAHCISAWGHDFRPEYLRLGAVIEKLGHPRVLALTATASPTVRDEIVTQLKMRDPAVIVCGFDRPNIHVSVERFADERAKHDALLKRVTDSPKPGIVYVATRRTAEELAGELWQQGVQAVYYHGGMSASERRQSQEAFMEDAFEVVVATTAFGMGIDKPNVRFVHHYDIPDALDSYYQEIGRAGRDGEPSEARLFYRSEDLGVRRFFASSGRLDVEEIERVAAVVGLAPGEVGLAELAEVIGLPRAKTTQIVGLLERVGTVEVAPGGAVTPGDRKLTHDRAAEEAAAASAANQKLEDSRLDIMRAFAETQDCRREVLLNHLGEPYDGPCHNCDNCDSGLVEPDTELRPFGHNSRVRHPQWGEGAVVRYEGDKITVLFDSEGYKTISLAIVRERDLLRPVK